MEKLTKKQIIDELWQRGSLIFLLDEAQKKLYNLYYNSKAKTNVWLLSRRAGKTYTLCVLAIEQCIKKPNAIVKFLSPTKIQVNNNVRPIMRKLLENCPEDLKPEFKEKDYIYYFPNGSEIQLAGTDAGHAEKLRGGDSDLWIVDEAGSCDNLDYNVKSIFIPTTLVSKGKGILASTPPAEGDHEFIKFIEDAEAKNTLTKMNVYDNPRVTKKEIDELIEELGGIESDACRRELFCELIKDSSTSVLPEFNQELEKEIVKDWPKPPFFDCYESMDLGGKDLTVVLFGYYDFRSAKVIIQDEVIMDFQKDGQNIEKLIENIRKKEEKLWYDTYSGEIKKPYLRISDINYIVTNEILKHSNYQMNFQTAKKDDKIAAINDLRVMLQNQRIIIDPRCTTLIRHLRNVKRNKSRNHMEFARSADNGHYDAVDALIYLIRSISYTKNPYPASYGLNQKDLYVNNPEGFNKNSMIEVYKRMFNVKRR